MWQSSRKCACRRELNSHDAAKPQVRFSAARWLEATRPTHGTNQSNGLISVRAGVSAGQSKLTRTPPEAARRFSSEHVAPNVTARMNEGTHTQIERPDQRQRFQTRKTNQCFALQDAECNARSAVHAADAGYRDCSCRGAEREAESHACKSTLALLPRTPMPNPSLKRSANGRPPGPVRRYAVHFRQPGPGVLPSSPA